MTAPDLAALSEAATQGMWLTHTNLPHGIMPRVQCAQGSLICEVGNMGSGQDEWEANASMITALVNAYRAGKLLVIEDEQDAVRRMARVIADSLGDDYDMVPLNKGEWIKARGMCGGFPRDINAPFRLDYDDAATAALAALKGE